MDRLEHALKYVRKPKQSRAGFIYLIGCHNFVKVGLADRVVIRLSQLQVGCPYELKLLAMFKTERMQHDEQRLHDLWRHYEVRGEWFQVPAGELAFAMSANTIEELLK